MQRPDCLLPTHSVEKIAVVLNVAGFSASSQVVGLCPDELSEFFDEASERQCVNQLVLHLCAVPHPAAVVCRQAMRFYVGR